MLLEAKNVEHAAFKLKVDFFDRCPSARQRRKRCCCDASTASLRIVELTLRIFETRCEMQGSRLNEVGEMESTKSIWRNRVDEINLAKWSPRNQFG
jgi:hypothetical protein